MIRKSSQATGPSPVRRSGFWEDFRRFFMRGLEALLPTLITVSLLLWLWNSLWDNLGRHLVWGIRRALITFGYRGVIDGELAGTIFRYLNEEEFHTRLIGVLLGILLFYIIGVLVGNLIGRTLWRVLERTLVRIPLVRAIYPSVKQIIEFVLSRRAGHFEQSRVVAVPIHEKGIWSVGLVTGDGLSALSDSQGQAMVTVFVPSSPTAFSGYVVMAPRSEVVELPMSVEEAMRLLISGGVIAPPKLPVREINKPSAAAEAVLE